MVGTSYRNNPVNQKYNRQFITTSHPPCETFPVHPEERRRRSKNGTCYRQWRAKINRIRLSKATSHPWLEQHPDLTLPAWATAIMVSRPTRRRPTPTLRWERHRSFNGSMNLMRFLTKSLGRSYPAFRRLETRSGPASAAAAKRTTTAIQLCSMTRLTTAGY